MIMFLVSIFVFGAAQASDFKLGVYSLATEAGWGSAFELKKNGTAVITPAHDTEEDEPGVPNEKVDPVEGTWKAVKGGVEVSYPGHRDHLRFEKSCREWKKHSCFHFEKAIEGGADKSLLKFNFPFVNWDVKK